MSATASEATLFKFMEDGLISELFHPNVGVYCCTINWYSRPIEWVEAPTPREAVENAIAKIVAASLNGEKVYHPVVEFKKNHWP